MTAGQIVILSGPSGSGKTSLHNKLLKSNRLKGHIVKTVSVTTRPRRKGERNGRDYYFVSLSQFKKMKTVGLLLESQKVFGYYYGTPRRPVEQILKKGMNVLLCIEVKGARVVGKEYPQALKIFIKTPSFAELKKRLVSRKTEAKQDLQIRLKIAKQELREAKHYDVVVVNGKIESAYQKLEESICSYLGLK
jgi:guanylate kinase